jgi:hypothetical protein
MLFANRHWRGRAKVPEQRQSAYPQFGRSQGAVKIVRVEAGPIEEAHQSIHQVAGAMRSGMLVTTAEAFALRYRNRNRNRIRSSIKAASSIPIPHSDLDTDTDPDID